MKFSRTQIVAIYALTAGAWIVVSDQLFEAGPEAVQTLKGLIFVGITSALLFYLIGSQRARAREQLIDELQQTEQRYAVAEMIGRMGHWQLDVARDILTWSPQIARLFELDPDQSGGPLEGFFEKIHPEDADAVRQEIERCLETGEEMNVDYRIILEDGQTRWFHANAEVERDGQGEAVWMRGTVQDVTERVVLERQHRQAAQRIKRLAQAVTVAQEEERERIAREIHDELGQTLTGLTFGLRALRARSDDGSVELIEQMEQEVKKTTVTVGKLASSLRPPLLDQFGLIAALEQLCREAGERYHIDCTFEEQAASDWKVTPSAAIQVFRIVQEALTNVARHAEASQARLRVELADDLARVSIQDDGKGFQPQLPARQSSFGIQGMRERARLIGGSLDIISSGEGTTVVLELPLVV